MILHLILFLSCVFGALIDARMWNDKKFDRPWLVRYTDILWLGNWNITMPWLWMTIGAVFGMQVFTLSFILKFILISFGMSVFWDYTFVKTEHNVWVKTLRYWAKLPWFGPDKVYNRVLSVENKLLVIGFNTIEDMKLFNIIRICVLIGTFFL